MKNYYQWIHPFQQRTCKLLRIMKLIVLILLAGMMSVSADTYSQRTRLSISLNKGSVSDLFMQIQKQSDYLVFYKDNLLSANKDMQFNLQLKNKKITDILDKAFIGSKLSYKILGRQIVVLEKENTATMTDVLYAGWIPVQNKITGKITDAKGMPLPGASVKVKGTAKAVSTDTDGKYLIPANTNDVLQVSFIGFKTKEVTVGAQTTLNIELEENAAELNAVVVVGYGSQKKVNLTGAVSTVSGEVLASRAIGNIGQGLQGMIPNLNITSSDGQPGRGTDFNIRGIGTINGKGAPLILVDGVAVDDINRINPLDVENVTVLKDAASAAVYGARGAFGVMLVTTKTGKSGATKINYSSNYAFHRTTHLPDLVTDPYTVVDYKNRAYKAYYGTDLYSQQFIDYAKKRSADPNLPAAIPDPSNPGNYLYAGATDWFKELYQEGNPSMNQNLSISGGGEKVAYYISGGYNTQTGVYRYNPDVFNRYNTRIKLDINLASWVKLHTNTVYNRTSYNYPTLWTSDYTAGDIYHTIGRTPSLGIPKNPNGSWTSDGAAIGFLQDGARGKDIGNEIQNTVGVELPFFNKTWRVKADYTFRSYNFNSLASQIPLIYQTGPDQVDKTYGHSNASQSSRNNAYHAINVYTEYEKNFGKHYLKGMVGFNQELRQVNFFSASRDNLISNDVGFANAATGDKSLGSFAAEWAILGAFYRLNYAFNDKYLLEVNGRYDGTSRFPKGDRYGFFPSASAGWRVSEESFFSNIKKTVNEFKLRASYGSLGNQGIDNPDNVASYYPYIPQLSTPSAGHINTIIGGVQPVSVNPPGLVSPTLTWEKAATIDFGTDMSLFDNRIELSYDWYQRKTTGMLTKSRQLPAVLGTNEPQTNAADLQTRGWEFTIAYHDKFTLANKPFNFSLRGVLSDYQTTITKYDNPNKDWFNGDYYVGQKLGDIWGLQTLGIFQSDAEAKAWANQSKLRGYYDTNVAGELKYADLNHDGKIDYGDGTVANPGDAKVIGNSTPRYSYGFNGSFNWNNIDFSFFIQGVGKRDYNIGNTGYYWSSFFAPWDGVYQHVVGNTWTPDNPNALYPTLKGWRAGDAGAWKDVAVPQTRFLQNAAYMRLKNVTIGYTLPFKVLNRLGVRQVRIYCSGENLLEFTHGLNTVFDPEGLGGSWGPGKVYPFQRTYAFGLNVNF